MTQNYLAATSLAKEAFDNRKTDLVKDENARKTPESDVIKIENILDLTPGILGESNFYMTKRDCDCGREISFFDFVFTALVEQWHSPSFLAHTLVGRKYFVNEPRPIRCSSCGLRMAPFPQPSPYPDYYLGPNYGCCV